MSASPKTMAKRRGLLLLNLGTPDTPEPDAVGRYLKEFLMDGFVIDVPKPFRWFLVNVMVVPKRKYASSHAYKTIWSARGSPLLFHLRDLAMKVGSRVRDEMTVRIAMRYGKPSIHMALQEFAKGDFEEILVFPLYPQYAESSTRSSVEKCQEVAEGLGIKDKLRFMPAFYDHPLFVRAFADKVREAMEQKTPVDPLAETQPAKPEHVLMSFHSLPERHIKKTDRSGGKHCLKSENCCAAIGEANRDCYRAQSYSTARALAHSVGLGPDQYSVSFQSRLGRSEWIKPETEATITKLAQSGVKSLAVVCPSFVADCLETVEEIGGRAAEVFYKAGGESFTAVPCPNSDDAWAEAVATMARDFFSRSSGKPLGTATSTEART